ncbi:YCII-related domain-containing protein [Filimonas lacunae]|uniref:YCII-related domain-containing protein n=1 Tax=Filimonas lacunae TaxID=477680 RepID=A0A173MBY2_9BACT|nr:YciI family protein [Filimonas lacunae]BAV05094.1 PhnB protein [Filimonas lacunae]SIT34237.1 YCII-related domain-containing protein [Filimonas lacunae]
MKDFVLLFRQPGIDASRFTPQEMETYIKRWDDWIGGIAAQGRLNGSRKRLTQEGKVLKAGGVITDGPFVEIKERLGGLIIVKAESLEEATTLAHGCPALDLNGSVEIRPVMDEH